MDLQETLDYIYSFVNYEISPAEAYNRRFYNISRVEELLARLGNPHLAAKSVHIAGTKGKGSTTFMIAQCLTESGYKTGLFTKPHLIDLRERWQVDNELMTESELIGYTARLIPEVAEVNRLAHFGKLTTFEIIVAIGFMHYAAKKCDFQVLEVGLGGTLDATNVIMPEVSVITPISYDHMEVLGHTLTEIASAKAGIIKQNVPVVSSVQRDESLKVIRGACFEKNAALIQVGADITCGQRGFKNGMQLFRVKGRLGIYDIETPLLGYYQVDNVPTAVGALEVLMERGYHVTPESVVRGLSKVSWPGRFQIIDRKPTILIDGAHNEDSAVRLKEAIQKYFSRGTLIPPAAERYNKAILILGTSSDHDADAIIGELYSLFDKVIVTRSRHPRAAKKEAIIALLKKRGITPEVTDNVTDAVKLARSMTDTDDLIVAAGSLFVVGEMLEVVKGWRVAK